jgi:hypothetical protein
VSFVERAYTVPMDVFDNAANHSQTLSTLPSTWDMVVSDFRGYTPAQRSLFPGIASWFDASSAYFAGQKGFAGFPKPIPYSPGEHWRLSIRPADSRFPGTGRDSPCCPAGARPARSTRRPVRGS